MDFFGVPLVIEPWPGQLSSDAALPLLRRFDQRIELTRAFAQAPEDSRGADLTRVLLSRASTGTTLQQNGNNIGRVSPMRLQRE